MTLNLFVSLIRYPVAFVVLYEWWEVASDDQCYL